MIAINPEHMKDLIDSGALVAAEEQAHENEKRAMQQLVDSKSVISKDVSDRIAAELQVRIRSTKFTHISDKLNERRIKYGIPNGAFQRQPDYDKIFVYQIPLSETETFSDTKIVMSEMSARREKEQSCRGVLVSAGLQAMDSLYSHGDEIGDVVYFQKLIPWRMQVDSVGGYSFYVMCMRDGDIVANEDKSIRLQTGEIELVNVATDGSFDFRYKRKDGTITGPKKASHEAEGY